ncbi:UNKNOWN [Stylonychia lemnae]|uniref:Uncharacterized protein n=1 Tax=Stylonychia lemnae TaxID=5949 RepID=A0A077ZNZ2_STYLE|nr:UNKNOWN [Stylonychia lemnae]|eukprot:CDW71682.1 UNKNOWN [Stylonychia lemnae]
MKLYPLILASSILVSLVLSKKKYETQEDFVEFFNTAGKNYTTNVEIAYQPQLGIQVLATADFDGMSIPAFHIPIRMVMHTYYYTKVQLDEFEAWTERQKKIAEKYLDGPIFSTKRDLLHYQIMERIKQHPILSKELSKSLGDYKQFDMWCGIVITRNHLLTLKIWDQFEIITSDENVELNSQYLYNMSSSIIPMIDLINHRQPMDSLKRDLVRFMTIPIMNEQKQKAEYLTIIVVKSLEDQFKEVCQSQFCLEMNPENYKDSIPTLDYTLYSNTLNQKVLNLYRIQLLQADNRLPFIPGDLAEKAKLNITKLGRITPTNEARVIGYFLQVLRRRHDLMMSFEKMNGIIMDIERDPGHLQDEDKRRELLSIKYAAQKKQVYQRNMIMAARRQTYLIQRDLLSNIPFKQNINQLQLKQALVDFLRS